LIRHPRLEKLINDIILIETSEYYYLPRLLYKKYPEVELICNKQFTPRRIEVEFKGQLRPEQTNIISQILEHWKTSDTPGGIIEAPPGTGKTVLGVYLTCITKLATMVIVDNRKIADQWINEYLKFSNVSEKDIDIVKRKEPTPGKKVYIAYVQTLLSRMKKDIRNIRESVKRCGIGLVLYDEVHRIATGQRYAKVSVLFDTPLLIGLSATPFSHGVHEFLMYNTIGPVIASGGEMMPCLLRRIFYNSGLSQYASSILSMGDETRRKAKYNSLITHSDTCKLVIRDQVEKLLKEGRQVFVVVLTVDHAESLASFLRSSLGVRTAALHRKNPNVTVDDKVIVSTYKMGSHGFNMPTLSAAIIPILLAGKVSLKQSIGRIVRRLPGKQQPIVVDLEDMDFQNVFRKQLIAKKNVLKTYLPIKKYEFLKAIVDVQKQKVWYTNINTSNSF